MNVSKTPTDFSCNRHVLVAAESNLLGFGIVHLEKEQNVRILVKRTQCLKELIRKY
jgi:hypothetical protein